MQAVRGRAYPAARVLMDCIKKISIIKNTQEVDVAIMMSMLYHQDLVSTTQRYKFFVVMILVV